MYGVILFLKNGMVEFWNFHFVVASQNDPFFALGKWKMVFPCDEMENFLLQHCSPSYDAHVCTIQAHYHKLCTHSIHNIGHLTRKPWNLEHDRSFREGFFETYSIYQVWYFSLQLCHIIWHHAKDFHCSDLFWISYAHFEFFEFLTMVEPACMKIGDEHI